MIEAARQANAKLQPARIGFGTGKAYINPNRDEKIGDAYHMGYAPEGPTDKTVAVILRDHAIGRPDRGVVELPGSRCGDVPIGTTRRTG